MLPVFKNKSNNTHKYERHVIIIIQTCYVFVNKASELTAKVSWWANNKAGTENSPQARLTELVTRLLYFCLKSIKSQNFIYVNTMHTFSFATAFFSTVKLFYFVGIKFRGFDKKSIFVGT